MVASPLMGRFIPLVAALALPGAGGCGRRPAEATPSAPSAAAGSSASATPAASASASPAASASAAPAASASGAPDVEAWLVGTWRGKPSVYAAAGDQQTYEHKVVVVTFASGGAFTVNVGRGEGVGANVGPVLSTCEAAGKATLAGRRLVLGIERTTCKHGKAGASVELDVTRVGACLVQWQTKRGTTPFAYEQIALRRDGCSP